MVCGPLLLLLSSHLHKESVLHDPRRQMEANEAHFVTKVADVAFLVFS